MLAKREAKRLLDENYAKPPGEAEEWESTATYARGQLRKLLGGVPSGKTPKADGTTDLTLHPEPAMTVAATFRKPAAAKSPACVVLHPDGRAGEPHAPACRRIRGEGLGRPRADPTGDR